MSKARPDLTNLEIRRATRDDDPGVLALMRSSLGWRDGDPNEELFEWKHRDNPFGESPAWVALHNGRVVGFRTFMRWEFLDDDNQVLTAVRAVDTATDPEFRGLGIFSALTMRGVEELTAQGVGFVFNTPNDQSRPGYLKMGWHGVGRIPVGVLPSGPQGLRRMARARTPAELWSEPTNAGTAANESLSDSQLMEALLERSPSGGLRTRRSADYLAWRTSPATLNYRLLLADPDRPDRGGLVFRLRRRGDAMEAVVIEAFVRGARSMLALCWELLQETGADYALATRSAAGAALAPLPKQGPILTARALAATPPDSDWDLTMADVELM
jgi:GNAT superfamily N-acetyltransferase